MFGRQMRRVVLQNTQRDLVIFLLSSFQFIFKNLVRSLPLAAKFVRSVYVLSDQLLVLVLEIEPVTINCSKSESYSTASCPYVSGKGHSLRSQQACRKEKDMQMCVMNGTKRKRLHIYCVNLRGGGVFMN